MECIKCYYESMILEQQILYAVLESEYNSLCGNEVVTEGELSSKVGEKFKFVLSTIGRWITNIINFVTKTIPAFIKGVVQKISDKINKRERNKKVVDATTLPKAKQDEVKSIAVSINNNNKLGRKIENRINTSEIKKELDNATKTDSSTDSTVVDDKEENLKKATEQYNENKKKIDEKISKIEDLTVKAELTDANNKKEEVVVKVDKKEPKFVGYMGMYINDEDMFNIDNDLGFANSAFTKLYERLEYIDEYKDEDDEAVKRATRNCVHRAIKHKENWIDKDLYVILDRIKSTVNSITLEEVTKDKLPTTKYIEQQLGRIKNSEKNILEFKKSIDTASRKGQISNEEALLFTTYFNLIMPATNRYIKEMTYTLNYLIKITTSFCDNAVAVYK